MGEYEENIWKNALYDARMYHTKKMSSRYYSGVDYDEDSKIYNNLPEIVKESLNYLCEIGEIE